MPVGLGIVWDGASSGAGTAAADFLPYKRNWTNWRYRPRPDAPGVPLHGHRRTSLLSQPLLLTTSRRWLWMTRHCGHASARR